MDDERLTMNINPLVAQLRKSPEQFTIEDMVTFVRNNNVRLLNFMYPGGDGKLKTLNFVITSLQHLKSILTCGERVDGSSLFNFIQASSSDLYVLPRFSTAFLDPFAEEPTLCFLCSYFDKDGKPMESAPEWALRKAVRAMKDHAGIDFHAMGELEYYVIKQPRMFIPPVSSTAIMSRRPSSRAVLSAPSAWNI